MEALDARWEEFEKAGYEERLALFTEMLGDPELMDGEMAFGMLDLLYQDTAKRQERHRFDELVEALRRELPDVFEDEAVYLLSWQIENALATGQFAGLSDLVQRMAACGDRGIDLFDRTIDQLAYHGHLDALVESMPTAWPRVKSSSEITPRGIEAFGRRTADFLIFDYLEREKAPDPADPRLLESLREYADLDPERLATYIASITGRADRHWTLDDQGLQPHPAAAPDRDAKGESRIEPPAGPRKTPRGKNRVKESLEANLYFLSVEYLGYLRREHNVPYPKGELARDEIVTYFLSRAEGAWELPKKADKAQRPQPRSSPHPLCPDRATLERFLASRMSFISSEPHRAAAVVELLPAWLRFLASRGLIDAAQRAQSLQDIADLPDILRRAWESDISDPHLAEAMARWNETAGRLEPAT